MVFLCFSWTLDGFRAEVLVLDARDLGPVPGARYLQGTDVSGAIEYHVPEARNASRVPSLAILSRQYRRCMLESRPY